MTTDAVGGVWQYSLDLARGLSALDTETVLAVMGPSPSEAQLGMAAEVPGLTLVDTGLELDWLADSADAVAAAGEGVAALAARYGAHVVHLNAPALAAGIAYGVPTVAVAHSCLATWWQAVKGGELPADFAWRTELVSRGLAATDAVVAPTAAFADATRRCYQLPARPRVVHNGRTPLPLPPRPMQDFAFTAGRLWDEGKNVATLDRMAARLNAPLRVAGPANGPNGARIDLAHAQLLGNLDDAALAEQLAAKPVFVSAARYEPFGLAVLEAAAAGCSLVLSDIPTFRELWDGAAIFVDPDDDAGFADAVEAILSDTAERLIAGQAARQCAERFTPAAMAAGMAAIYRELTDAATVAERAAA